MTKHVYMCDDLVSLTTRCDCAILLIGLLFPTRLVRTETNVLPAASLKMVCFFREVNKILWITSYSEV